jgi:uncharacterized phage protein (TIGR01671 family)
MREIKFRIWSKPLEKWVSDLFLENIANIRFATIDSFFNDIVTNENVVLQQYTGLKDKNGKEIYEGDIVKYCSFIGNDVEKWEIGNGVIFEMGCFWVGNRKASGTFEESNYVSGHPALMYWQSSQWFEVIGNTFENKDLLK